MPACLSAGICGTLYITQSGNECAGEPCAAVSRKCIHGVAPSVSIPLYTTMLPANCWASLRCAYWGKLPGNAQWKVQYWAKFPTAVFLFGFTGGVTLVKKLRVGR